MKIYNTMSQKKEKFIPLEEGKIKMYACGITVSGDAHIGHFLQALVYDIIRKYLQKKGYKVTYCRNYTDVDDKIIATSSQLGVDPSDYAKKMIKKTNIEMKKMQVDDPDIWMNATASIDEIMDFIKVLIKKGNAYVADSGDVYFSVQSFPRYGQLSNRKLDKALDGVRVEVEEGKKSPLDFALWKQAKQGEPSWKSPWGNGRPGWHIECSAMNLKALGEQIDIHGGGRDLVFPHHENEIAQTEAYTGKRFASFWVHNGLIKVDGQKMSKSLGNSIMLEDLIKKYHPEVVKFALLQNSYRNDINVTDRLFTDSEKHILSFNKSIIAATERFGEPKGSNLQIDQAFDSAMDDDFNTAVPLANLFGYFKEINAKINKNDASVLKDISQIIKTYSLLGLFVNKPEDIVKQIEGKQRLEKVPEVVVELAEKRLVSRNKKDWKNSDELRDQIAKHGYTIKDTASGYELIKN